jgi:hypothetical protein
MVILWLGGRAKQVEILGHAARERKLGGLLKLLKQKSYGIPYT